MFALNVAWTLAFMVDVNIHGLNVVENFHEVGIAAARCAVVAIDFLGGGVDGGCLAP